MRSFDWDIPLMWVGRNCALFREHSIWMYYIIHLNGNTVSTQSWVRPSLMPRSPTDPEHLCFYLLGHQQRYLSLGEELYSLSERNQYPIILFQGEMAERKEREITSYIMATPIHGCVSLLLCSEVKLGWDSWKWNEKTNGWIMSALLKKISWYETLKRRRGGGRGVFVEGHDGKIHATHLNVLMGGCCFLIETSFIDNKHATSLYKPTQISVQASTSCQGLASSARAHTHGHIHIYISQWMMGKKMMQGGLHAPLPRPHPDQRCEWQHSCSDSECLSEVGGVRRWQDAREETRTFISVLNLHGRRAPLSIKAELLMSSWSRQIHSICATFNCMVWLQFYKYGASWSYK